MAAATVIEGGVVEMDASELVSEACAGLAAEVGPWSGDVALEVIERALREEREERERPKAPWTPGLGLTTREPEVAEQLEQIAANIRGDAGPEATLDQLVEAGGVSIVEMHCHCETTREHLPGTIARWEARIAKLTDPDAIAAERAELEAYHTKGQLCGACRGFILGMPAGLRGPGAQGLDVESWEISRAPNAAEVAGDEYASKLLWYAAAGIVRMRGLGSVSTCPSSAFADPLDRFTDVTPEAEGERIDYLARALLLPAAPFLAALEAIVNRDRWHVVATAAARNRLDEHGYGDVPARLRASFPDACESVIVERLTDIVRLAFVGEMRGREPELARLRAAAQEARTRTGDARGGKVARSRYFSPSAARALEALIDEGVIGDGIVAEQTIEVRGLDLELGAIVEASGLSRVQVAHILTLAAFVMMSFADDTTEAEWAALRTLDVIAGRVSSERFSYERDRLPIGSRPLVFPALMGAFVLEGNEGRAAHYAARDLVRECTGLPRPAWAATCVLDFVAERVATLTTGAELCEAAE